MSADRLGAVIVTYYPTAQLRAHVAALRPQVDDLVIVDNGSEGGIASYLEEIKAEFECRVILNEKNLGVATALNIGVVELMSAGCAFVALFDQDSCVTEHFIDALLTTHAASSRAASERRIGIVAPTYVDERSGAPMPLMTDGAGTVLTSMTSGSLFPVETFQRCGLFDEALFIDYVDIEYCLRVSRNDLRIVQTSSAMLFHSLGALRQHRFGGKAFSATNHSAARRYYITRNRVTLFARYLTSSPEWVVRDLWAMLTETVKILLVEDNRFRKLSYICLGLRDAAFRRTGYRVEL